MQHHPSLARPTVGADQGEEPFGLLAGHGLFHLGQMRRTLAQVAAE